MRTTTTRQPAREYALTALDERLLHWLLCYPLQRAEDLAVGLARWRSRATVYRRLGVLEQQGWLETLRPVCGMGTRLYHLSPSGLRWYTALETQAPIGQAERESLLRLLPRLPALLPVQDQINGLITHLAGAMTHQGRRPTLVRWTWLREYAQAFTSREQRMHLRAEAACAFCIRGWQGETQPQQETWFACFLLYLPLTSARLMRLRLDRLLRWRECAERWSHYHAMPPVLILATSSRQREWWQYCAERVAAELRVDPLVGAITCLSEKDFAPVSPWQRAWKRLVTHEQCHLHTLFQPLPLEALPAALRLETRGVREGQEHIVEKTRQVGGSKQERTRTRYLSYYRLENVRAASANAARPDREELALLSLQLTPRLWQILILVFEHPLLSRAEVAALLDLRSSSTRLFLTKLRRLACLISVTTSAGERWQLAERGLRLLALAHHTDVRNLAQIAEAPDAPATSTPTTIAPPVTTLTQRGAAWLRQHSAHTAGIYGFFARLARNEQEGQGLQGLRWWETSALCERRYRRQERWHSFKPDALAEYQVSGKAYRFWLEWDEGTMNVHDLRTKFASYAFYIASREWVKERTPLPFLLCVAPDIAQEQRLQRVARALITQTAGLTMYTTTAVLLEKLGPLASVWRQVLPPHLETEEAVRVHLFLP